MWPDGSCPAIFVFDFGFGSRQEIKQNFRCLSGVFRAPQFYDKWCKVDAKRENLIIDLAPIIRESRRLAM